MNTLAPPSVPARRPGDVDELQPPAPTQASVPAAFASLTWPADVTASELPAPTVAAPNASAGAPWSAPTARRSFDPPAAEHHSGWNWTPIMDAELDADAAVLAPPSLRGPDGSLSIELSALEAVFTARSGDGHDEAGGTRTSDARATPVAAGSSSSSTSDPSDLPVVSFEAEVGSVTTEVTASDTAVVTATVPAFVTYAPATELVLPEAPPREPVAVEAREIVVHVPRQNRAKPRRTGRSSAVVLLLAAAVSAAAYLGFREYIYGDTDIAGDGTRVVEVEPARTIVVVDAP